MAGAYKIYALVVMVVVAASLAAGRPLIGGVMISLTGMLILFANAMAFLRRGLSDRPEGSPSDEYVQGMKSLSQSAFAVVIMFAPVAIFAIVARFVGSATTDFLDQEVMGMGIVLGFLAVLYGIFGILARQRYAWVNPIVSIWSGILVVVIVGGVLFGQASTSNDFIAPILFQAYFVALSLSNMRLWRQMTPDARRGTRALLRGG